VLIIQVQLRLAEAQQLFDALDDPLIKPALEEFFREQKEIHTDMLLSAVRQSVRDTMKEARLAGKVEAYEDNYRDLRRFAEQQLRGASQ
jgi:hypothetical protein